MNELLLFVALTSMAVRLSVAASSKHHSGHSLVSRQLASPPADRFVRRADAAVTVLGDYLYVVGGGVAVRFPDDKSNAESHVAALNRTLALSLKNDWQSRTAQFAEIEAQNFPTAIGHALWTNPNSKEVVFWGGKDFNNQPTGSTDPKVWTLAADGNGGGTWASKDAPNDIRRAAFGGYTVCGGKGYFIGGYGEPYTDGPAFKAGRIAVPGLISYDFENGTFKNESTKGLTDSGAFQKGSAVCVELPGRNPKLFVIGGAEPQLTNVADNNATLQSFDNAFIYDLGKEKWFKQETQGSRPIPRQGTCAIGASGPNGTYEIFMYGGFRAGGQPLDDAWVLSIPAFRWFKVDADSDPRYSHACARVGSQMVVVGGNNDPVWNKRDPFPKGLGVFSLNTLEWKDGFEANSAPYQGPSVVQEWYDQRGPDTIPWGSNEIREAFLSINADNSTSKAGGSPISTPAIIGGGIGGVLALILAGLIIWWWWRRRRLNAQASHKRIPEPEGSQSPFEMKSYEMKTYEAKAYEMDSECAPSELNTPDTERAADSKSGAIRAELDAKTVAVELPA